MAAVRLQGVTKTYGDHVAVNDLSLEVPEGSVYGFIGPNGSGKTTTLRMILHIIHADRGTIEVLGQQGTRAANDLVGYLPEERGLYKKLKVLQVLEYYAALKGMGGAEARREGTAWLERLGLPEVGGRKIETLSKGMAQKIQFIATVITRPRLLILDEPFTGLDPVNHEAIRDAILELNRDGTTVIFSTHDMNMAEQLCDFVFMIFKGDKVLDDSLARIRESFGKDTLRLRAEGAAELLAGHPAVEKLVDLGNAQEVRLRGDPQEVLATLAGRTRVELFELASPSLHDIFVRIAGPEAAEAAAASRALAQEA